MNQFESLCKLASDENWCWDLYCTTCGHMHFRYAFQELGKGRSPIEENWVIHARRTNYEEELGSFSREYSDDQKENIIGICKEADLIVISNNCRFPDWLGYLGLILWYMRTPTGLFKELSLNWATQLMQIVPHDSEAYYRLDVIAKGHEGALSLSDLEKCEKAILDSNFN